MLNRKRLYSLISFIFLLAAIPLLLFLAKQQQNLQQEASNPVTEEVVDIANLPNKLLVTVAGKDIYTEDVKREAEKQYKIEAINKEVLNIALESLIEKAILDEFQKREEIQISQEDLSREANFIDPENPQNPAALEEAKYQALRKDVEKKLVTSWSAYNISFWTPPNPESYPDITEDEKNLIATQLTDGEKAFAEAERQLKSGSDPLSVTKEIAQKYPSLAEIIGVNGYNLSRTEDSSFFENPVIYYRGADLEPAEFFNALFSMSEGEVKMVKSSENNGITLVKLEAKNNGDFESYDSWLQSQRSQLVTRHESI